MTNPMSDSPVSSSPIEQPLIKQEQKQEQLGVWRQIGYPYLS